MYRVEERLLYKSCDFFIKNLIGFSLCAKYEYLYKLKENLNISDFDEDRLPFFLDESEVKIVDLPYMYIKGQIQGAQYNSPMLKGVAHQLRRWPNDLFSSFMAACLIISGLVLFAFVTAILCSPATSDDNCWYVIIIKDLFNTLKKVKIN